MGVRGETSIEGQDKVGWNIPGRGLEVLGGGYFVTREKGQGRGRGGKDRIFLEQKERVNSEVQRLTCSLVSVV